MPRRDRGREENVLRSIEVGEITLEVSWANFFLL